MAHAVSLPGNNSLRRSEGEVGLMARVRRMFGRRRRCSSETAESRDRAEAKAADKLHDLAVRLHVLEWEAYGQPKRRPGRDQ